MSDMGLEPIKREDDRSLLAQTLVESTCIVHMQADQLPPLAMHQMQDCTFTDAYPTCLHVLMDFGNTAMPLP